VSAPVSESAVSAPVRGLADGRPAAVSEESFPLCAISASLMAASAALPYHLVMCPVHVRFVSGLMSGACPACVRLDVRFDVRFVRSMSGMSGRVLAGSSTPNACQRDLKEE